MACTRRRHSKTTGKNAAGHARIGHTASQWCVPARGETHESAARNDTLRCNIIRFDETVKSACKPGSVGTLADTVTIIPLGPELPPGSSHLPADSASRVIIRLFGVAPGGGYRAVRVPTSAVRSYRTVSPLPDPFAWPSAVYSLLPCHRLGPVLPPAYSVWALPSTLLCGARTFLHMNESCSDRPADFTQSL